MNKEIDKLINQ